MSGLISKVVNESIAEAQKVVSWPETYVNAKNGRVYKPHNEDEVKFVYDDSPRFTLLRGGEGCLDGNSLINNIPVAEWGGGEVESLEGLAVATKSYLKGCTDLYQVKTTSKKNIIVTLDHRFYSPLGWNKLRELNIGSLIAVKNENTNTWDTIDSITFKRFGEYYDLSVPITENYLANDIYNHNSGKSVALIVKILNRLRRGMSGAVISPNMPSFRRSLFPELMNWLPRSVVIENHQRYFSPGWRPRESFIIVVHNELGGFSELLCASAEAPRLLEGPNLNFVAMDEIRGMKDDEILLVMAGRIRVDGPNKEPFQLFCSSTPSMNWVFDWFGPIDKTKDTPERIKFKEQSFVGRITVQENIDAGNIPEGFLESRSAVLTESQRLVRVEGEWHDEDNPEKFIPDMLVWDNLFDPKLTPPRPKRDPNRNWSDAILLAIDASVSRDYTALVGVTRDPNNRSHTCVRICRVWEPIKGGMIDFMAVQKYITEICKLYHVILLSYDSFQMEQMAQNLFRGGVVAVKRFAQQNPRTLADQFLFDSILTGTISHMNDPVLRQHLDNSNCKIDDDGHKKRIIKRAESLKVDAAVALSMANYECSRLNI